MQQQEEPSKGSLLWEELQSTHNFPLSVLFCLTERCCMACPHCYLSANNHIRELSFGEIVAFLDELAELGTLQLTITGGEPGLRDDLFDIINEAYKRHFDVSLKTSCYLFDNDSVVRLWDAGLSRLQVSLYHIDSKEHDRFVGRDGAWIRAVNALELFSKKGGQCRTGIIGMEWNASHLLDLFDFCNNNGWLPMIDESIRHRIDGSDIPCALVMSESSLSCLYADVRIPEAKMHGHEPGQRICSAGVRGAYITSIGSVQACALLPWSFGNLRESSFRDIWLNSKVREHVVAFRWNDSSSCHDCPYEPYCTRCPGDAVLAHGNPNKPTVIDCYVAKARYCHARGQKKT